MRRYAWLGLLAYYSVFSQNWVSAGMPGYNPTNIIKLTVDSLEDRLLAVGFTSFGENSQQYIMRYSEGVWDSLGIFTGGLFDAQRLMDTLFAGGNFYAINDLPIQKLAAYFNNSWHASGAFDGVVRNLKIINGELYAIGGFRYVDGQLCNGIARRAGGQWHCFDPPPQSLPGNSPDIYDAEIYQGQLYACGVFALYPTGEKNIMQFDGNSWIAPGGGLIGGFGYGKCLTVYQDELYLGGGFSVADGNAGNCIMKWNGSEWSGLNGDLQDYLNGNAATAAARDFLHHDGKLLVGGHFSYAAGNQASRFAVWDGLRWCSYSDVFGNTSGCESMAIYNDTLYAACGFEVNGQPINQVIKWVGDEFQGKWCNSPIGIEEAAAPNALLIASLGNGLYRLHTALEETLRYQVVDATGRVAAPWRTAWLGQDGVLLDMRPFADGLYVVQAIVKDRPYAQKISHDRGSP